MRPRPGAPLAQRPLGQFAGQRPLPQSADLAVAGDLLDGLMADGAMRVSSTSDRRRFTGSDLNPQRFVHPAPADTNSAESLQVVSLYAGNTPRMLNRTRNRMPGAH